MKNVLVKITFIMIVFLLLLFKSVSVYANDFPVKDYQSFLVIHKKYYSSINNIKIQKAYNTAHLALIEYLCAEKENLEIFEGITEVNGKKLHIYRDNLDNIIKQRKKELYSLLNNDKSWLSQTVRKNISNSFRIINKRVPYDRGEPLRSTFRKVDKKWQNFVKSELVFYDLVYDNDNNVLNKCKDVLYESRLTNLYNEMKGVLSIKIEKED